MKLSELLKSTECVRAFDINLDTEIASVVFDENEIRENSAFVFFRSSSDGAEELVERIEAKDPALIISESEIKWKRRKNLVYVQDARRAFAEIMIRFHSIDLEKIKFVAVTGTNGKTTTAHMIRAILREAKKRVGFIGTGSAIIGDRIISEENYSMTTPDPDLLYRWIKEMQTEGCEYVIMEVSSHALSYRKVSPISFEVSVFTNLSAEHLDFHKSMNEYFSAKMKLFDQSKSGVFNCDDEYSKRASEIFQKSSVTVGIEGTADAMARCIATDPLCGTEYIFEDAKGSCEIKINLPGVYNVYNSLCAIAACRILGIDAQTMQKALRSFSGVRGRFEVVSKAPWVIIDYAHTPEAMSSLLFYLYSVKKPRQKLISVFGCGGNRDRSKRPLMAIASEKYATLSIVTSDNSRGEIPEEIIKEIVCGFSKSAEYKMITDRARAIEYALSIANKDDVIAIIGKGAETYNIDKNGYHYFDERKIISDAIRKRG